MHTTHLSKYWRWTTAEVLLVLAALETRGDALNNEYLRCWLLALPGGARGRKVSLSVALSELERTWRYEPQEIKHDAPPAVCMLWWIKPFWRSNTSSTYLQCLLFFVKNTEWKVVSSCKLNNNILEVFIASHMNIHQLEVKANWLLTAARKILALFLCFVHLAPCTLVVVYLAYFVFGINCKWRYELQVSASPIHAWCRS